jgi:hypothetical protein
MGDRCRLKCNKVTRIDVTDTCECDTRMIEVYIKYIYIYICIYVYI